MEETRLNDIGSKIAAEVVASTAALNDQLDQILVTQFNIPINPEVHNGTWLTIAYFGLYTLLQRAQTAYSPEDFEKIQHRVEDSFLYLIMNTVFVIKDEEIRAKLETDIKAECSRHFELYKKHVGDTALILRDLIRDRFNVAKGSRIKFVDGDWKTKLKLNAAIALGGFKTEQEKYGEIQFLKSDFLLAIAQAIAAEFRNLDLREFILE